MLLSKMSWIWVYVNGVDWLWTVYSLREEAKTPDVYMRASLVHFRFSTGNTYNPNIFVRY